MIEFVSNKLPTSILRLARVPGRFRWTASGAINAAPQFIGVTLLGALSTGIGQSTTGSRRPFRTYVESAGLNGASQWSPH